MKLIEQLTTSPLVIQYVIDTLRKLNEPSYNPSDSEVRLIAEGLLNNIRLRAPKMYKVYTIPKRNGGKRVIAHPARPLKAVQRALVEILKDVLPIHSAAFAYRENVSIKKNADMHKKNKYFLKMDFSDFFNSIDVEVFESQLDINEILIRNKKLTNQILFWSPSKTVTGKLKLSVGAPSSPIISNFVMFRFDSVISEICKLSDIHYTRYADDLFFSSNVKNSLFNIPKIVKYILKDCYKGKLRVNESKTSFSSRAHNVHVTGITITNQGTLSLGRKRKRYISSLIHKYKLGILDEESVRKLQGLLGFAKSVEPLFISRLSKKYSSQIIDAIVEGRW